LTNGEIAISNSMTIVGPGPAVLAVSGGGFTRLFRISAPNVTISGLTLRDGTFGTGTLDGGGAIKLETGHLGVTDRVFVNHRLNSGSASGGALLVLAGSSCSLYGSTFSTNRAPGGGAVSVRGTMDATHCTFSGNIAFGID
jgi:hypothetical protein